MLPAAPAARLELTAARRDLTFEVEALDEHGQRSTVAIAGEHPLTLYRAAGVPVALSTDDSGVSRNDLTNEYLRAVTEHGLQYTDLRQISRDSLTYSFIEGESLWDASGMQLTDICKGLPKKPSPACTTLLTTSAKAKEQWRLEQAFAGFEAQLPKLLQAIPPAAL